MIVEAGEKLTVHVECGQILGEDDNAQADQRDDQDGNGIDASVQCEVHADECDVAGTDEIHSVFALGKKMNHDNNSLRKKSMYTVYLLEQGKAILFSADMNHSAGYHENRI